MPCTICRASGHNKTSCPLKKTLGYCTKCKQDGRPGKVCFECGTLLMREPSRSTDSQKASPVPSVVPYHSPPFDGPPPMTGSSLTLTHNRRSLGALRVSSTDVEMRWTFAALLEAQALTEHRRVGFVSDKSVWAKLKHSTYIVLNKKPGQHNGGQIRTWRDAVAVNGVGETSASFLSKCFTSKRKRNAILPGSSPAGPFPTIAEALLVSLLRWRQHYGEEPCPWPLFRDNARELYKSINPGVLPEMAFPDLDLKKKTACWRTCHTLSSGGVGGQFYIDACTCNKVKSFRLTAAGVGMAELVCKRARECMDVMPSQPPLRKATSSLPQGKVFKAHHGGMSPNSEGIVMFMDRREGGGETNRLNLLYADMIAHGLRIEVRSLHDALHDYCFVWRIQVNNDGDMRVVDYLLPCLIERKSRGDVADSMRHPNPRWDRQKSQIQAVAKRLWPEQSNSSPLPKITYILEGDDEILTRGAFESSAKCGCAEKCRGVNGCVRMGAPTVERVERKLQDLLAERSNSLHVEVTKDGRETGSFLAKMANLLRSTIVDCGKNIAEIGGIRMDSGLGVLLTSLRKHCRKVNESELRAGTHKFSRGPGQRLESRSAQNSASVRSSSDFRRAKKRSRLQNIPAEILETDYERSSAYPSISSSDQLLLSPSAHAPLRQKPKNHPKLWSLGTKNSDANAKKPWYRPRRQGSNYAILICLLMNEQGVNGGSAPLEGATMTKDEILDAGDRNFGDESGRRLCDKGMRANHRSVNSPYVYDAGSGIKQLLDVPTNTRSRYLKKGGGRNNAAICFSLTPEGRRIAELCHQDAHFHDHCGCGRAPKGGAADWIGLYGLKDLKLMCKDVQITSTGKSDEIIKRLAVKWKEINDQRNGDMNSSNLQRNVSDSAARPLFGETESARGNRLAQVLHSKKRKIATESLRSKSQVPQLSMPQGSRSSYGRRNFVGSAEEAVAKMRKREVVLKKTRRGQVRSAAEQGTHNRSNISIHGAVLSADHIGQNNDFRRAPALLEKSFQYDKQAEKMKNKKRKAKKMKNAKKKKKKKKKTHESNEGTKHKSQNSYAPARNTPRTVREPNNEVISPSSVDFSDDDLADELLRGIDFDVGPESSLSNRLSNNSDKSGDYVISLDSDEIMHQSLSGCESNRNSSNEVQKQHSSVVQEMHDNNVAIIDLTLE